MAIGWAFAIIFYLVLAALPAKLAYDKGYRAWFVWFLFGLVAWIVALLVVLCLRNKAETETSLVY
jgi:hypothetical protein